MKSRKVRKGMALFLGLAVSFAMAGKAKAANKVVREGISVSGYTNKMADGTWRDVDWKKVKEQGKEFVFIRCGYRGPSDDEIGKDSYFEKNLEGALEAGLDVGVYFVSQAINENEARAEANYTMQQVRNVLKKKSSYELTLPIVVDFEDESGYPNYRLSKAKLSRQKHDAICKAFADQIEANGFTAGYYTSKSNLETHFTEKELSSRYPFWYAKYGVLDKSNVEFHQYNGNAAVSGAPNKVTLERQYITTPSQVKNERVTINARGQLYVSWNKVPGVYGYEVYRMSSKTKKEERVATIKGAAKTSYHDTKVENGVTYTYRIRAIKKTAAKIYYGGCSNKVTKTYGYYRLNLHTQGGKIVSGNQTAYVSGTKVTLPTKIQRKGYLFAGWYDNASYKKAAIKQQAANAKGNKNYYAKWTKVSPTAPKLKAVTNTVSKSMQVSLNKKVKNVDGYEIRYSEKANMKAVKTVKIKNANTISTKIKNLKKGRTYYVEVYSYKIDSTGAKVLSKSSNKKSVKIKK